MVGDGAAFDCMVVVAGVCHVSWCTFLGGRLVIISMSLILFVCFLVFVF